MGLLWRRSEGEVAGVDGFAGVVEGGWVGGPVGEGGFGFGLFGAGEGDAPVGAEIGESVPSSQKSLRDLVWRMLIHCSGRR